MALDTTERVYKAIDEAVAKERQRCVAEIRHVQKRNTATDDGKPNTWNRAVETMADECVDAIETPVNG